MSRTYGKRKRNSENKGNTKSTPLRITNGSLSDEERNRDGLDDYSFSSVVLETMIRKNKDLKGKIIRNNKIGEDFNG